MLADNEIVDHIFVAQSPCLDLARAPVHLVERFTLEFIEKRAVGHAAHLTFDVVNKLFHMTSLYNRNMYFGAPPPDHAEAENAEQIVEHKNPLLYIIALIYTKIHTFGKILYII